MNDIERAIETLKDMKGVFDTRGHKQYSLPALDLAILALEKQLNNGWIPVSERLPTVKECQENDCRFIVTDGNRRYQNWFDYENNYFDRCACNGLGLKRDSCVIAWQPLPEPLLQNVRRDE